ncbi:MAG: hypothetical protein IPI23_13300 [Bacteroidetes bacterium]|nr:hypothetical protein [Bacteroidota bacterium]
MKALILTFFGTFYCLLLYGQLPNSVNITSPTKVKVCHANRYTASFPNGVGTTFTLKIKPVVVINSNNIYTALCANSGQNDIGQVIIDNTSFQNITLTPTSVKNEFEVTISDTRNSFEFDFLVDCSILSNTALSNMNAFFNSEWTINGGANINTTGTNIQMEYPYLVNLTPNAFSGIYQGTNDIFLLLYLF